MHEAVVIGTSAGGMNALAVILPALPDSFPLPVAVVQHLSPHSDGFLAEYLDRIGKLRAKEAEDKEPMRPGYVYVAPAGYHLLVESDRTFSLSVDAHVNFCRPSIDVLFESAAEVFQSGLIGVVLTGANADGSHGLMSVKAHGGLAVVQDPESAEASCMPRSALERTTVDYAVALEEIAPLLIRLTSPRQGAAL